MTNHRQLFRFFVFSVFAFFSLSACTMSEFFAAFSKTGSKPVAEPIQAVVLPTYSEVVKDYPKNAKVCCSEVEVANVTADGKWTLVSGRLKVCKKGTGSDVGIGKGGLTISAAASPFGTWNLLQCLGSKVTVQKPITINGKTYEVGAKLVLDKDMKWTQVSDWK